MRPTVGVRDLTAHPSTQENFPGDRRLFKGPGEELFGDYAQKSNTQKWDADKDIIGAKLRPTVGVRDESADKWTLENFPGDLRINKAPGAEIPGDYAQRSLSQWEADDLIPGAPLRATVGVRDLKAYVSTP